MKEAFPNYYHKFKCIADKCKHSCCIGWEIDIDDETMQLYASLGGETGERIRQNIEGDPPHFVLQEGERCPFLNERGLCDIILTHGEEMLCDICTLHPRFRNFYSDFAETGLGLCCEEAVRIILSEEEKFRIDIPENAVLLPEEKEFFKNRAEIFCILQDREKSIGERFSLLAKRFGFCFDFSLGNELRAFLALERLDEQWTDELKGLEAFVFGGKIFENKAFAVALEQLAVYFVFRHLTEAMWDGDYSARVRFCLLGCFLIGAMWECRLIKNGKVTATEMADIVRMYSSEIEYSEENTESLINRGV